MLESPRRDARPALAKINLVLEDPRAQRPDGFHDLRTIFQTISLPDTLEWSTRPPVRPASSSIRRCRDRQQSRGSCGGGCHGAPTHAEG